MTSQAAKIEVEFVPASIYAAREVKQQTSWMSKIISFPFTCIPKTFRCLDIIRSSKSIDNDTSLIIA